MSRPQPALRRTGDAATRALILAFGDGPPPAIRPPSAAAAGLMAEQP